MIECIKYFPINKKTCLGIANIYVEKWDLEMYGITLHQKDGKRWVSFPSKEYEKDGEKKYAPYYRFRDKETYYKFCKAVKEAIEKDAQNHTLKINSGDMIDDSECPF